MPTVAPFILQKPKIELTTIGGTPASVEIQCSANQVVAEPDQDETTVETFCGSYTSYKAEVWTITVTALQSYGTDGLWTKVRPLAGEVVEFVLLPDADAPVSVDNPEMSGTAIVKAFPFLDAAVGEASEFDLVLGVQGLPTFGIVAGAQAQAQTQPEPEPANA